MKNRRFSSPFISFYEIVIIPTLGSSPSVWVTIIHSTFPCSSILFLDLPNCCSPLVFPVVSSFPPSTVSKHNTVFQLKFINAEEREEGPLCMSPKDTCKNSNREKSFPLCMGMCDYTCAVERSHMGMYKYIYGSKKKNWKFKYRQRLTKINHTATSCLLCHMWHLHNLFTAPNCSLQWFSTIPINHIQTHQYAATAIPMFLVSLSPPLYNTCSDSSGAWSLHRWSHLHPESNLIYFVGSSIPKIIPEFVFQWQEYWWNSSAGCAFKIKAG